LTVSTPAGSPSTSGYIKLKVTRSADTDLPINSVIDRTAASVITHSASATAPTWTPAVAGSGLLATSGLFEFLVFEDSNLDGDYNSGERFVTTSLRLAGAPTTYSVSLNPSSGALNDSVIVDVTFSDGTYATATDAGTITMTAAWLTGTKTFATAQALGFTGKRRQILSVNSSAVTGAAANTASFTDTATIFTSAVTKTATFTFNSETAATKFNYVADPGIEVASALDVELEAGDATGTLSVDLAKTTVYYTATTTAGAQVKITTTPNASTVSTTISTSGVRYYTALADGTVTFPVTISSVAAGKGYTITAEAGGTDFAYTVAYADPGAEWTILPGTSFKVVKGGSQKFTAQLTDTFGRALASKAVTASVSGRNTATFSGTTDANGVFEFTTTDTDTRACCSATTDVITDTVTLTYNYTNVAGTAATATGGSVTITYIATAIAATTITILNQMSTI